MSLGRRDFLKTTCACAGLLTSASAAVASGDASLEVDNAQVGMLYDATKCVGCKACMSACKRTNKAHGKLKYVKADFDPDGVWDAPKDLDGDTRTIIKLYKEGSGKWSYVKHSCMHCQKPSCVSVCPVGALTKDKVTGVVSYNEDYCIGCRYCQVACPFNIPKFQWDRPAPQIVKCNFCKNTYLKEKGISACASVCPSGAILFGKRQVLLDEARRRIKEFPGRYIDKIYGETEVGGVNHLYLSAVPFEKLGLPTLPSDPPAEFSEKIQHTIYKGFIAPIALYSILCYAALRNMKKQKTSDGQNAEAEGGGKAKS